VLLFARVDVLGVAWLRIASAALVFALWRRLFAFVFVSPIGLGGAAHAFTDPVALAAGVGVGVSSSVIPYVFDQLAMAKIPRATYALFVALLPATALVIGVIVLQQIPTAFELAGVALVMVGVALHRPAV
jgi:inner membrane transporter RhtA